MALRFCKRKWSCAISLPPGEMTILSLCSRDCDVIFGIAVATVRGTADVRLQVHGRRLDGGPFTRIEHPRIAVYPFSARKPFHAHMLSDAAVELCAQNPSPDSKAKLRVYWNKAIFADERDRPRCDEGQAYEQEFGREGGEKVHLRYRDGLCGVAKAGGLGPELWPTSAARARDGSPPAAGRAPVVGREDPASSVAFRAGLTP